MRMCCILVYISVIQLALSQRFPERGNFRNLKRGHARRFGRRSTHRPWRPVDWKTQYNHLNRHYGGRRHLPWETLTPGPTDDINRIVTRPGEGPGNLGGPDTSIIPASSGGSLLPQIGNIYCAVCCRVHWYYYNNCIRRFCASRGPDCPPFG